MELRCRSVCDLIGALRLPEFQALGFVDSHDPNPALTVSRFCFVCMSV